MKLFVIFMLTHFFGKQTTDEITLHDNNYEGTIPDSVCEVDLGITADC